MKLLTLDCETYDPLLKKYGMGWCFKYHYPTVEFEVLIFGYITHDGKEGILNPRILEEKAQLWDIIREHDSLLFHNAMYDLGALRYLYRDAFDIKKWAIYDTMIMGKLEAQQLISYSLDNLTKHYQVTNKQSEMLTDYVWKSGLYQKYINDTFTTAHGKPKGCHTRPSENILHQFVMSDLRRLPFKVVAAYCVQDIRATKALFNALYPKVNYLDLAVYSDIIKVCLDAKTYGLRVNLTAAKQLSHDWNSLAKDLQEEVKRDLNAPEGFNLNSTKQLGELLDSHGIKVLKTDKGNNELKAEWLESHKNLTIQKIARYRKALKADKDFVQKLIRYQNAIPLEYRDEDIGWIYPTMKPLGATATGRFSSGGGLGSLELNMLAISRRNEEFGLPIRELFLPHEGEKFVCCDFSNQEPRLQVHYAHLLKCGGTKEIIEAWKEEPNMKYHQTVADMTHLPYDVAKMVTLGLAYDMHAKGLSIKLGISLNEASALIKQYHKLLPFMEQLQMITSKNFLKLGYIKTIGGRKLKIDTPYIWNDKPRTQERKAMSKLIQGSGADQTIKAMISAWKQGLKVLLSVHDEILVSAETFMQKSSYLKLRDSMEQAYPLCVPVVAEGGIGNNWAEAK